MVEVWRPSPEFPRYIVSSWGRVRLGAHTIRAYPNTGGYPAVTLFKNGRRYNRSVHVLVLEAFSGPRPKGLVARHLNGDKTDPRKSNLKWGTHKENSEDQQKHGTQVRGDTCGKSRICESQARQIKALKGHQRQIDIAAALGVSLITVRGIHQGKTWRHV